MMTPVVCLDVFKAGLRLSEVFGAGSEILPKLISPRLSSLTYLASFVMAGMEAFLSETLSWDRMYLNTVSQPGSAGSV